MSNPENKNAKVATGTPWGSVGRFQTYEAADTKRSSLIDEWGTDTSMQVKVKRMSSDGMFVVKVRKDPTAVVEKAKAEKKAKRTSKKHAGPTTKSGKPKRQKKQ